MATWKRLFGLYLGDNAQEGHALAIHESDSDPPDVNAMSPGGLGVGILQQSARWQSDYTPSILAIPSLLYDHAMRTDNRWHPAYQIACYATFCKKHADMKMDERFRLYHYGHPTMHDPDDYVEHVMRRFAALESLYK